MGKHVLFVTTNRKYCGVLPAFVAILEISSSTKPDFDQPRGDSYSKLTASAVNCLTV
jgi:hypothetical protein